MGTGQPAPGLKREFLAALTIALVGLPQCIAYALLSGVPAAYGLVTAAVPGLVAAALGRSGQIITGPTNTTGLLILAALAPYLGPNGVVSGDGLAVVATLTVLAGLLRLAAALAGGAAILDFLPESVLTGFTSGAAVLIAAMQLDEGLGLGAVAGGSLRGQIEGMAAQFAAGALPNPVAVAVAGTSLAAIVFGRRLARSWPVPLLVVLAGAVLAALFSLDAASGLPIVADRAPIPTGWPEVRLPSTEAAVWEGLAVPALAIVLIGTLEMTASARAGGAMPDLRREIIAQGAANLVGGACGAFPASASLTRSALLRLSGARTRRAAALSALLVVPVMFIGAPLTNRIPQASLAGVLWVTAAAMIDLPRIRRMLAVGGDTRLLLILTFAATLVLPLEWAVASGALLGLVRHLDRTMRPRLRALVPAGDDFAPLEPGTSPDCVVVEVSGSLHYAAVRSFVSQYEALVPAAATRIVIDLSHAHHLRFAALSAMERLAEKMGGKGGRLVLAGVPLAFAEFVARAESHLALVPERPIPMESLRQAVRLVTTPPS